MTKESPWFGNYLRSKITAPKEVRKSPDVIIQTQRVPTIFFEKVEKKEILKSFLTKIEKIKEKYISFTDEQKHDFDEILTMDLDELNWFQLPWDLVAHILWMISDSEEKFKKKSSYIIKSELKNS